MIIADSSLTLDTTARCLYRYALGQATIPEVRASLKYLFIKSRTPIKTSDTPLDSYLEGLLSVIRAVSISEDWHQRMHIDYPLTDKEANRFLNQLFSTIESDLQFLHYQNVAVPSAISKDSWRDHAIFRPQRKAGWTMHVTTSGSGFYDCVRTQIRTEPGDIMLFSPTAYLDGRRAEESEHWHYEWIMFQNTPRITELLSWPEVASGIYHIKAGNNQQLERVRSVTGFIREQGWSLEPAQVKAREVCIELLMLRCHEIIEEQGYQQTDRRIQDAIHFIEDSLFRDFTLEQVADVACLSPSALALLFKKHCGVTVMQWREEKRMAAACHKLVHTSKRISQISDELGYLNQMYFARCFRRYINMTPSEYRRKHCQTETFE
ncbi:hypothetical protein EOPP23_09345 [Endozoicomonas sp. OPT23]|uniref:helix-turn-helix domain-containing protein n=1 Tax=Endozoicomonas sp. OPT23 TaxID=2072845 RepID=UPI00129AD227|nr:AraC family transcriptional regulator [Endozoicomonas sp. OPT23]MRI33187.1 hypothetical protein [Endozoicomonas sp. OPT23]